MCLSNYPSCLNGFVEHPKFLLSINLSSLALKEIMDPTIPPFTPLIYVSPSFPKSEFLFQKQY